MATFRVQLSLGSTSNWYGPNFPSVEIGLDIKQAALSGGDPTVFTSRLASEREIDATVNKLIGELEQVRARAKRVLHDYADWTQKIAS